MKNHTKTLIMVAAMAGLLTGCASDGGKKECKCSSNGSSCKGDKESCGSKNGCSGKNGCRAKGNCGTKGS